MPTFKTRGEFVNSLWDTAGDSAQQSLGMVLQKQQQDKQLKDMLQKLVLENSLKGMRLKQGSNVADMGLPREMQGVLGNFEPDPMAQLERQAGIADAENKIYQAGGPAPSFSRKGLGQQTQSVDMAQADIPVLGQGSLVPKGYDQFGRPTGFTDPQQEVREANMKPLAGEAANRYSGSVQGLTNIKAIQDMLKLNETGSSLGTDAAKDMVYRANLIAEANAAKPTWLPGGEALYKGIKSARVTKQEPRELENYFNTLAENVLRARTGAAAPDQEVVREMARTYFKVFNEDPQTWMTKLANNKKYLEGVADEIRPLRKGKHLFDGKISKEDNIDTKNTDLNSITEDEIQFTMKKYNVPREEVIRRIGLPSTF